MTAIVVLPKPNDSVPGDRPIHQAALSYTVVFLKSLREVSGIAAVGQTAERTET